MKTRPPYSRTERLIAIGRVPLAAGALVIAWQAGASPFQTSALRVLLGAYLLYSVALVPILSPAVQPANWWALTTQAADLLVVVFAMVLTAGTTSPFYSYLLLTLATATVRWGGGGALVAGPIVPPLFAPIGDASPPPPQLSPESAFAPPGAAAGVPRIGLPPHPGR